MSARRQSARLFDRLMRQALRESQSARQARGAPSAPDWSLSVTDADAVPVFDRGPAWVRQAREGR